MNTVHLDGHGVGYISSSSRRDASRMISDYIGHDNNSSKFQLGQYNMQYWNQDSWIRVNNCYAYACNIRVDNTFPHPGYNKFGQPPINTEEFLEGVKLDGLVEINENDWQPEKRVRGDIDNPAWIVALCDGYTEDTNEYWYHFYRKVWSGNGNDCGGGEECYWAHKNGTDPVTNKIKGGSSYITDPRDDMRKYGLTYRGLFLVSPNIVIYAPS
ncbi:MULTISPECIES: hypothetical protein [Photorhabdus]|uniref:Uncharacterized protein n=1 Tax=Photorhabdus thracensis TaxID=230089 RepID=A0A0F7LUT3_9GAMM|nr:hypothetical protein [Photorhabdus thracensis]AKH65582.1 hypothetical protein VY86_21710 [Photorhabdus thracensis]MCC8422004.1 hypothetical protein [Photorhabdus thracensis]